MASKRWLGLAAGIAVAGGVAALVACGATQRPDGGSGLLPAGSTAPDVTAVDQNGASHALSAERGHPVVVYFYPKDATPGCTKEACAFRDAWDQYQKAGVTVFGVSSQDQASHAEFAKEQKLPFSILADPDHVWAKAFGVKLMVGLTERVSFLVGKDGKIAKVYPDVDPAVHAGEVLRDAAALP